MLQSLRLPGHGGVTATDGAGPTADLHRRCRETPPGGGRRRFACRGCCCCWLLVSFFGQDASGADSSFLPASLWQSRHSDQSSAPQYPIEQRPLLPVTVAAESIQSNRGAAPIRVAPDTFGGSIARLGDAAGVASGSGRLQVEKNRNAAVREKVRATSDSRSSNPSTPPRASRSCGGVGESSDAWRKRFHGGNAPTQNNHHAYGRVDPLAVQVVTTAGTRQSESASAYLLRVMHEFSC
jgi:hypothetical protein